MDRYDRAIAILSCLPDEDYHADVDAAWLSPTDHITGCLFMFMEFGNASQTCCPVQFKYKPSMNFCPTPEIAQEILNDPLIPSGHSFGDISREGLQSLARIQRKLDTALNRDWSDWDLNHKTSTL